MHSKFLQYFILIAFICCTLNSIYAQPSKDKPKEEAKTGPKSYSEVITDKATSDEGLFTVHQIDEKYFYEIPFSMLETDMLLVSRISKIAAGIGGGYTNAGSKTNEQVIRWVRKNNKVLLRSISFGSIAADSLPISQSVYDNNYQPIISAFDIKAFNKDSSAVVIEINSLFLTDVPAISGLSSELRTQYKVKALDAKRSFINRISSYPKNIEVRHDMTFSASAPPSNLRTGTISYEMAQSMYMLPEKPMQPRLFDPRVGWITINQIDYGSDALKADKKTYIRRWKLIPKDIEAYNRGELVEPVNPIIYYLDPATPTKWIPYFMQGIEDWQVAFEQAGFKNAILAKIPPTKEENPDWSPEDARYSTIRYVATTTRNAMGPSVIDPRSGEIIESDIVWYHNHLRSYRNRYMLETGAANPSARTLNTPELEIGEMMRRVISHEVGHALGLPHNMKASYAYPTDSLRSASFTQKWGLATTIMDYTRYNYVAQPGDKGVRWVRMLGPYDMYAINWGYRYISKASSPAMEKPTLSKWITDKKGDPKFLFGAQTWHPFDPSSQTESVGDDPVKASSYGLSNLKIVAKNLSKWTATKGEGYDDLKELYGELISVWSRFANHVVVNIGGVYEMPKTTDQSGPKYTPLEKSEQTKSMQFLNDNVFSTPKWLLQSSILSNIGPSGSVDRIRTMQTRILNNLLLKERLMRMIDNEAMLGTSTYSINDLFLDLRNGLWSELKSKQDIDIYRRNLQRAHVMQLIKLLEEDQLALSDVGAAARAELMTIQKLTNKSGKKYKDAGSRNHLLDIQMVIKLRLKKPVAAQVNIKPAN